MKNMIKSGQIMINLHVDLLAVPANRLQDMIQLLEVIDRLTDKTNINERDPPVVVSSLVSTSEKAKKLLPEKEKAPRKPRKPKDGIIVTMIPPTPPISQHQASEYIEEELEEEI